MLATFTSGWRPVFTQFLAERQVNRIAELARGLDVPLVTLRSPNSFLTLGMDWATVQSFHLALTSDGTEVPGEDPRTASFVQSFVGTSARWLISGRWFNGYVDEWGIPPGHYGEDFSALFSKDDQAEPPSPSAIQVTWSLAWAEPLTREQARAICVAALKDGVVQQAFVGDPSLGVDMAIDLEAARILKPRLARNHKWIHENGFDPNPEQILVSAFHDWELWLTGVRQRPDEANDASR